MRVGKLQHRMMVQTLCGRENDNGETPEEYADAFEVYASLSPLSQSERIKAEAVQRSTTHTVTTHYSPDIDSTCRLRYGERYFDIVSVINVEERNRELLITVKEHGK